MGEAEGCGAEAVRGAECRLGKRAAHHQLFMQRSEGDS